MLQRVHCARSCDLNCSRIRGRKLLHKRTRDQCQPEILNITAYSYQDSVLRAWLEICFTPERNRGTSPKHTSSAIIFLAQCSKRYHTGLKLKDLPQSQTRSQSLFSGLGKGPGNEVALNTGDSSSRCAELLLFRPVFYLLANFQRNVAYTITLQPSLNTREVILAFQLYRVVVLQRVQLI